jgi:protein-disulfide isomerase
MSNRQARREQTRGTRQQRPSRPTRSTPAKKPSSGGPDFMSRPYLLGVAGLIIILAGALYWFSTRDSGSSGDTAQKLQAAATAFPNDLAKGASLGSPDAPIKMTQYEDFQCPICLGYTAGEEPAIIKEYVTTGKVQLTFKNFPLLGLESTRAASAAYCATQQEKFWPLHDALFLIQAKAGQDTNEKKNVGRFSDDNLKQVASDVGLDRTKFDSCLDSPDTTKAVSDQQREATGLGINGTPGFTINGTPQQGRLSIEEWRKTLDDAYKKLTTTPTPAASAAAPTATKAP